MAGREATRMDFPNSANLTGVRSAGLTTSRLVPRRQRHVLRHDSVAGDGAQREFIRLGLVLRHWRPVHAHDLKCGVRREEDSDSSEAVRNIHTVLSIACHGSIRRHSVL